MQRSWFNRRESSRASLSEFKFQYIIRVLVPGTVAGTGRVAIHTYNIINTTTEGKGKEAGQGREKKKKKERQRRKKGTEREAVSKRCDCNSMVLKGCNKGKETRAYSLPEN